MSQIANQIKATLETHPVVLYMKGSAQFPQCGFSSRVVQILGQCHVAFKDINVLEDPELRQGIKDYSNWPTLPQLYVHGELIGGCDIVTELFEKGELQKILKANK
jgi:monothiol glutaredoxin